MGSPYGPRSGLSDPDLHLPHHRSQPSRGRTNATRVSRVLKRRCSKKTRLQPSPSSSSIGITNECRRDASVDVIPPRQSSYPTRVHETIALLSGSFVDAPPLGTSAGVFTSVESKGSLTETQVSRDAGIAISLLNERNLQACTMWLGSDSLSRHATKCPSDMRFRYLN